MSRYGNSTLLLASYRLDIIAAVLTGRDSHARGHWFESSIVHQKCQEAGRYAAYKTALEAGFLTLEEVRRKENLPALPERVPAIG